jgi:hypothetical protein
VPSGRPRGAGGRPSLDPFNRVKKEHRVEFETDLLNDQQRKRLKVARDYALEKQVLMWQWWKRAGGEIDPEMQKEIASKRKVLKRKPDTKLPSRKEAQAAGMLRGPLRAKKLRELRAEQAAARKWLEERRVGA